jgi:serine/threonine-protein kinase
LEVIGRGAFGTVYRAVHPVIGKEVAVKVLDGRGDEDFRLEERFVTEARAVNRINHRNIVDIFGFGELPQGQKFYVMELLSGETLSSFLARTGALDRETALRILEPLADALDAAHLASVLHRDLKPANVFLQQGPGDQFTIKLLDFGVAKILEQHEGHATKSGASVGTPAYMAPEQSMGEAVGPATDIYALGVIAYEVLTGTRPFKAANVRALISLHLFDPPPPPSTQRAGLTAEVDTVLLGMLAKRPEDRPKSARRAIDDLSRALAGADQEQSASLSSSPDLTPQAAFGGEGPLVSAATGQTLTEIPDPPTVAIRVKGSVRGSARVNSLRVAGVLLLGALCVAAYAIWHAPNSSRAAALGSLPERAPSRAVTSTEQPPQPTSAIRPLTEQVAQVAQVAQVEPAMSAAHPQVWLTFAHAPRGTVAFVGSERLGSTAEPLSVPFSEQGLRLKLTAPGYRAQTLSVIPNRDQRIELALPRAGGVSWRKAASDLEY